MLNTQEYKYTLRVYNNYCFFTAPIVARKCPNVALYVRCLSYGLLYSALLFNQWGATSSKGDTFGPGSDVKSRDVNKHGGVNDLWAGSDAT